jgi:Uma2 family endonuclease
MSLADFDHAEVQEGYLYELGRGVITVSDVPRPRHLVQVIAIRRQLDAYDLANPSRLYCIVTGSECKLLIDGLESERHPDLAIYKTPPPNREDIWSIWVPEVVIEVVSPGSEQRDYEEKREEYLRFGVREYWIFDAEEKAMLVLTRSRGQWSQRTIRPPKIYRTKLLLGLEFDCALVFEAAQTISE